MYYDYCKKMPNSKNNLNATWSLRILGYGYGRRSAVLYQMNGCVLT